ncbi:MAG TPA: glycine cleavage system protein H, partial [Chloroflexota bacterium]|nr:glycine cleavage system protein H [Chloroflexota bacterium]
MGEQRYAESHEWVSVDGNAATVGISEFAVEQLGDV